MFTEKATKILCEKLGKYGISDEVVQRLEALNDDSWAQDAANSLLARVNDKPLKWVVPVTKSYHDAKVIMGRNFLGIDEVEQAFGVTYSAGDRAKLAQIPFPEEVLRACADTHVLVAGFPMSINDVRKSRNVKGSAAKLFYSSLGDAWYERESFANTSVEVRWFLLRKKPVDNSTSKTYEQQLRLIPQGEENPWARDVVFATIVLFLTTGERLYESVYVRCKDVDPNGCRVCVGDFDRVGLYIFSDWDGYRDGDLGVCSVRNSGEA